MTMNKLWNVVLIGLVLVVGCNGDEAAGENLTPSLPLASCNQDRLAVAHRADGDALDEQPAGAPFSCAVQTGTGAYDAVIAIKPDGTLFFSPSSGSASGFELDGLLRSDDNGASWSPLAELPARDGSVHPWLWRDAASGRLFFTAFNGEPPFFAGGVEECGGDNGSTIWLSDDDGASWERVAVGCDSQDYGKVITGPAATDASRALLSQNGYPSMVYYCATGPTVLTGPNRMCYRSTDGGRTFTRTASDPSTTQRTWPEEGSVGDDGSIYIAHASADGLAIAISRDEGDSWRDVVVPGSAFSAASGVNWLSCNVRADDKGNVYAVWVDDDPLIPHLSYSRDRGETWSAPIVVAAPGVLHARYPNIGVKRAGYVAIAYYGSVDEDGNGSDGYFNNDQRAYDAHLTISTDVFADDPLFWSAQINETGQPVLARGMSYVVSEYIGPPQFGPDGSIWAGFKSDASGIAARVTAPRP